MLNNPDIIEFPSENGASIRIETTPVYQGPEHKVGPSSGKAERKVEEVLKDLKPMIDGVTHAIEGLADKPNEVEVTLQCGFSSDFNLFLAKATGSANLSVRIMWSFGKK